LGSLRGAKENGQRPPNQIRPRASKETCKSRRAWPSFSARVEPTVRSQRFLQTRASSHFTLTQHERYMPMGTKFMSQLGNSGGHGHLVFPSQVDRGMWSAKLDPLLCAMAKKEKEDSIRKRSRQRRAIRDEHSAGTNLPPAVPMPNDQAIGSEPNDLAAPSGWHGRCKALAFTWPG